ncbi:uncharacterized protein LOC143508450 isoform X2 [Brachyhypopomus gauderio]|uniref:uncharacterized protein LOC143508450 isoform X2 n=1 Tax=Brachyhypopomus gauderio TaxID=698409 RepID=UPI0040422D8F
MTKLQLLHRALNERLMAAVEQIMEMVGGTVLEYEEETVRARRENEVLRRRLRWVEGENPTEWPGEAEPSGLQQQPVSLADGPALEPMAIKTEPIDTCDSQSFTPDSSLVTPGHTADLEAVEPATSTPADSGLHGGASWDSAYSYMAPLDFDPTLPSVVRHWRGRSRSQRMSFACPDCGKVFGREHRLIIHMRVHSAERPYAYRRRKACFYGDKKRKKKLHKNSKTSQEITDELSDASEQTERSTGLDDISAPATPAPSAPEAEPDEAVGGASEQREGSAGKPVGLRARQGGASKMPRCLQCKRVFTHVSRLAIHMKTHRKPLPAPEKREAHGATYKPDRRSRQHPKKSAMRNNETEVERARAGGQTLFQCSECRKVFARSCWLTFHLKSHERERALARKQLKQRQPPASKTQKGVPPDSPEPTKQSSKEVTGEDDKVPVLKKIFACPYCDKVFAREGWLGPHIRSHTSKTPQNSGIFADNIISGSAQRRTRRTIISQSFQQLKDGTKEATTNKQTNKVSEDSKRKIEKPEKVTEQPKASNVETTKNDSESKRNSETKRISNDESEKNPDETNQIPDDSTTTPKESSGGKDVVRAKKRYTCRQCGKVYLLFGCLKTHKRMHKLEKKRMRLKLLEERRRLEESLKGSLEEEKSIAERRPKRSTRVLEMQHRQDGRRLPKKPLFDEVEFRLKTPKNEDKPSDIQPAEAKSKEAAPKTPGRCICKHCGKVYARRNWLNLHILGHRKRTLALQQDSDETCKNDDEQTSQGGSSADDSAVQKGKDRGKAFPCPFCEKAFPRAMQLMGHVQIHSGEKPYPYRQRKEQFYGDLTRPRGPNSDSQEPAIENTDERGKDDGVAVSRNQTSAVSQDHTSTTEPMETVQPQSVCTGRKFSPLPLQSAGATTSQSTTHSKTDPKSVGNAISHFSLQPRIVLEPITAEPKHWTASGEDGFSTVSAGTSDVELHQNSELADAAIVNAIDYQVSPTQITLENFNTYGCHDGQNPLSSISYTVLSETDDSDIVCVKLGSFCNSRENTSYLPNLMKGDVELVEIEGEPDSPGSQINSPSVNPSFTGTVNSVARHTLPFSESEIGSSDQALISYSDSTDMLLTASEVPLAETSAGATPKEADIQPVYTIISDADEDNDEGHDDCDWLNVSSNLDEKKTSTEGQIQLEQSGLKSTSVSQPFQDTSGIEHTNSPLCADPPHPAMDRIEVASPGIVDKIPASSSEQATDSDSDVVFVPNKTSEQSEHGGPLANEEQTDESRTDPKVQFTCVPCGLNFDSESSLALHKKMHSLPGGTDEKSLAFKKLKKKFKNMQIKQHVAHIQTSEIGREDSADIVEISGERNPATLLRLTVDELSDVYPDTDASRSPRAASTSPAVGKEPKKEKKTLYCRFCGKACRKIELHLKYDHSREPQVMEALRFSKTSEERKKLLGRLCSKEKMGCDTIDGVRSGKAEDLVHCLFCKGSYLRNQFWKHALICEEKKTKDLTEQDGVVLQPTSRPTQETFEPESENAIQGTICNTTQQTLPESSTIQNTLASVSPLPETDSALINPNTGPETEDPPVLYIGNGAVKMNIDSESSDPPILDSFHSAHVHKISVPDTGNGIAKNPNVEPLSPPVLDSCHAAPEAAHLELETPLSLSMDEGREQNKPDSECSDPPVLESCHGTPQDVDGGESTCPLIDSGGVLDAEQPTAELMSLPLFDATFENADRLLTSALKSPPLADPDEGDVQRNIGQDSPNSSQNVDCVAECVSPPESVVPSDNDNSGVPADATDTTLPTTYGGDLQETSDYETLTVEAAMPNLECVDSQQIAHQELNSVASSDPVKDPLNSESANSIVPEHVGYETGDSSIQVFETNEHVASATEPDSPAVWDHIPKETQQTPDPESNVTYSPTKQMFDSEGHIRANMDGFVEVANQDCDFKSALDSDSTTTVKRKLDRQSGAAHEEPKRCRLNDPLQKTPSEECEASTSTAPTSEQEHKHGPQPCSSNPSSPEDGEGKARLYKTHYCFYCRKPCVRMVPHLQSVHANEPEVAKALSYEKNSKERKQFLDFLRSKGDFLHNTDVVRSGEGCLVPSRRLGTASSNEHYEHCIYCLGLFSKRSLSNHVQRCKQKYPDRAATSCSDLLPVAASTSPSSTSNIGCTAENLNIAPVSPSGPPPDTSLSEELLKANPQSVNCTPGDEENPHAEPDGSLEREQSVGSLSETGHSGAQLDGNTEHAHSPPEDMSSSVDHADLETGSDVSPDTSFVGVQTGSDVTPDTSLVTGQTGSDYWHKGSPCNQTERNMSEEDKKPEAEQSSQRGLERRRRSSRPHIQPMKLDEDSDEESVSHSTKLHVCEHCSASFSSPYHLRRHVYTHTGERPYWCSQCNMGFIQKYRFRNHRMTHHGETQLSLDQELARHRKKRSHNVEKPAHSEPRQQPSEECTAVSPEPSNPDLERPASADKDKEESSGRSA